MQAVNASTKNSSVIDLSDYRSGKSANVKRSEEEPSDDEAIRAIEEIAHHLLMAVRVIKKLHQKN